MRCRVSFTDNDGIEHACEVEADSMYEAAGLGIARFRKIPRADPDDSETGDPTRLPWTRITVEHREPSTSHTITREAFDNWFRRKGRSPREQMCRARVREAFEVAGGGK